MRPLIIIVNNFLPFYGETIVDLRDVGAAVISGKNETGKSSFFIDGPLFALFGHARKRQEGLIHDLADNMWVRFYFSHQNKYFVVQRSVTRNKQQKLSLYQVEAIDKVDEWDKGTNLTERLLTITQEKKLKFLQHKVMQEKQELEANLDMWNSMVEQNASMYERINQSKLQDYIKKAQVQLYQDI